jgi:hypothetical protein
VYLAHEAGRLAGVQGDRIGQWARWGHIQASVSAAEPHVYAFDDVAEAIAVHELLDLGFALPAIRRAVEALGGARGWPLARSGLHVVHGRLAVERGGLLLDLMGGSEQEVLPFDGRLDPVAVLRAGGWPARALGLTAVEVDAGRLGGRPTVRGSRIAVEDAVTLADPSAHGLAAGDVEEAARWLAA